MGGNGPRWPSALLLSVKPAADLFGLGLTVGDLRDVSVPAASADAAAPMTSLQASFGRSARRGNWSIGMGALSSRLRAGQLAAHRGRATDDGGRLTPPELLKRVCYGRPWTSPDAIAGVQFPSDTPCQFRHLR